MLKKQLLLLVLIGFLLYLPSFGNQFVWDDEQFIYRNEYVLTANISKIFSTNTIAGAGEQSDYYRPLTTLSFAIDHAIWGLRPFGFHLTNTLLHTTSGIFLFLILIELSFDYKRKPFLNLPFLVSLIFLIHPLQTEAVVYMNSRGDSLYTFFAFLSLYLLSLSFRHKKISINLYNETLQFGKVSLLIFSSLAYIASIFSKEIGIMTLGLQFLVILVVGIHQVGWQNLLSFFKKHVSHLLYFCSQFLIAVGYMGLRATVLNFSNSFNLYGETNLYTTHLWVRLMTFNSVLWQYFKLLFWPHPLYMDRNVDLVTQPVPPLLVATIALTLIIIGLSIWEYRQTKKVWLLFGALWFAIGLTPVSGIIPINGLMYEHWLYVPMVGFWLFWFRLFQLLSPFIPLSLLSRMTFLRKSIYGITSIFIITLCLLTLHQNWLWRSPISLYTHLLQYTESARIHNNLAMAYSEKRQSELAIEQYQAAIRLSDIYPQTHHNLGNEYASLGKYDEAIQEFETVLRMSPQFYLSYIPLIKIYLLQEKYDRAQKLIEVLRHEFPHDPNVLQLQQLLETEKTK